jgi:membrane protein DedA with SNARE-associated domain
VRTKRIVAVLVTALVAIVIVSATLGREIYAGHSPSIVSFALIHFAGYLFFLLMPVEALVPIYQSEGHSPALLLVLAVTTALVAQAIDYSIGRAVSDPVIQDLIGERRYLRFRGTIERWGGFAIFIFNVFPLSSPNMLFVAGITRYNPGKAFLYSFVGLAVKYSAILYVFDAASIWMSQAP